MKLAVTGAAGDFGTAILRDLIADERVEEVVCVDLVEPRLRDPKLSVELSDVRAPHLADLFEGVTAVVHLAFMIVPGRDLAESRSINRDGSANILEAAAHAGVARLVVASSLSAMGLPAAGVVVDDSSPLGEECGRFYFDDKAAVERMIEAWEADHPDSPMVITRMRPGFVWGPDFNNPAIALMGRSPALVPDDGGNSQIVHQSDIARAFATACFADHPGPFLLTTDDAITTEEISAITGARVRRLPVGLVERFLDVAHGLRLSPVNSEWAVSGDRHADPSRARSELGWEASLTSRESAIALMAQRGRRLNYGAEAPRKEVLERALEIPTAWLRGAVGQGAGGRVAGVEGVDLDSALERLEHDFIGERGIRVHLEVHEYGSDAPTLVLHHGLGDHVRRFTPLAARLHEEGFNVVMVDRPGHGLSEGRRGDCRLETALDVVEASARYARERFDGPVAMLGDSLGGITLWFALTREIDADAVVCHCIGHPEVDPDPSFRWKRPLAAAFGRVAPLAPVPVERIADYGAVALDPVTQAYFDARADALFNFTVSARSVADYLGFQPRIGWRKNRIPTLVTIGGGDAMVTPDFTRRSFERSEPAAAVFEVLDGLGHQLYLDHLNGSFEPLVAWLRAALEQGKAPA